MKRASFIFYLFLTSITINAQSNNYVLLHNEIIGSTSSELAFYQVQGAGDNILSYSVIITVKNPSSLGPVNYLGEGLVSIVVPESMDVDYNKIEIRMIKNLQSKDYTLYSPSSENEEFWMTLFAKTISLIPGLSALNEISPIYEKNYVSPEYNVDRNKYDIVNIPWGKLKGEYQKIWIDVPVNVRSEKRIGLYAYWQTLTTNNNRSGPIHTRDNVGAPGFDLKKNENSTSNVKVPPKSMNAGTSTYLVEIRGGGGPGSFTKLLLTMDKEPVSITGKGIADARDGNPRIAISSDGNTWTDFQGGNFTDLSRFSGQSVYLMLNGKWGNENDSEMTLKLTFNGPATINYRKVDNSNENLDYVNIVEVK